MHRDHLLRRLAEHRPFDERERAMRDRTVRFVERHENCFERTLLEGHITGSAWILDLDRSHALLTHHGKLDRWLQLGGHADGDPDAFRVALREAREESGLARLWPLADSIFDVDIHPIPARGNEPEHFHYDIRFAFQADRHAPLVVSAESKSLAWIRLSEIAALNIDESVSRLVKKTLSGWPQMPS